MVGSCTCSDPCHLTARTSWWHGDVSLPHFTSLPRGQEWQQRSGWVLKSTSNTKCTAASFPNRLATFSNFRNRRTAKCGLILYELSLHYGAPLFPHLLKALQWGHCSTACTSHCQQHPAGPDPFQKHFALDNKRTTLLLLPVTPNLLWMSLSETNVCWI